MDVIKNLEAAFGLLPNSYFVALPGGQPVRPYPENALAVS